MARELQDIQNDIIAAKDKAAELSALEVLTDNEKDTLVNLDSTSRISIWRLWVWIVAFAHLTIEKLWDQFKIDVTKIAEDNRPHNLKWYKNKVLAFQYGHPLVNDDEYAVIDEEAQIVKQASVTEGDRTVIIKVATLQGDDLVKIDDTNQVDALLEYLNSAIKDAGTNINLVNRDADGIKLILDVYYDPILITSDGKLTSDPGVYPVFNPALIKNSNGEWDALQNYVRSIEFDGRFVVNKLIDFIQKVNGVIDVHPVQSAFKAGLAVEFQNFERIYHPISGYVKLEDVTINYMASV